MWLDALFFLPIYEGFGMPPLEAIMCGTKVISSDIAPLREVLGEYGIYFKNKNKVSLQNRLLQIDSIKENIIPEEVVQLKNKFSWEISTGRIYTFIS